MGNFQDTARIWRDAYVSQAWNEYPYAKPLSLTIAALDATAVGLYRVRKPMDSGSKKRTAIDIALGSITITNIIALLVSLSAFMLRYLSVRNERLEARARQAAIDDSEEELSESSDFDEEIIPEDDLSFIVNMETSTTGTTGEAEEEKGEFDDDDEPRRVARVSIPLNINAFYADRVPTVLNTSMHLKKSNDSEKNTDSKKDFDEYSFLRNFDRDESDESYITPRKIGLFPIRAMLLQFEEYARSGRFFHPKYGEDCAYHWDNTGLLCRGWNPNLPYDDIERKDFQARQLWNEFVTNNPESKDLLGLTWYPLRSRQVQRGLVGDGTQAVFHYRGDISLKAGETVDRDIAILRSQMAGITGTMRLMDIQNLVSDNDSPTSRDSFSSLMGFLEVLPDRIGARIGKIREIEEQRLRRIEEERRAEEERLRKLEEQRKAEEAERQRKIEAERQRKLEEERQRQLEEKRKADEAERQRKLEERKRVLKFKDLCGFALLNLPKSFDVNADYTLKFLNDGQELYRISVPFQHVALLSQLMFAVANSDNLNLLLDTKETMKRGFLKPPLDDFRTHDLGSTAEYDSNGNFKKRSEFESKNYFIYYWNDEGNICEGYHHMEDKNRKFEVLKRYVNRKVPLNYFRYWYESDLFTRIEPEAFNFGYFLKDRFRISSLDRVDNEFQLNLNTGASRHVIRVVPNDVGSVVYMLRLVRMLFTHVSAIMGMMHYVERPAELDTFNALREILDTKLPDRLDDGFRNRMIKKTRITMREVGDGERVRILEPVLMTDEELIRAAVSGRDISLAQILSNEDYDSEDSSSESEMRRKLNDEGSQKVEKTRSMLKYHLRDLRGNRMDSDTNYDMVFCVSFYSLRNDIRETHYLDLKLNLPAELIVLLQDRYFDIYKHHFDEHYYDYFASKPGNLVLGEGVHLRYLTDLELNRSTFGPFTNGKQGKDLLMRIVRFNETYLFKFKGREMNLNGRSVLQMSFLTKKVLKYINNSSQLRNKNLFRFCFDVNMSSEDRYLDDLTILQSHLAGFSEMLLDGFVVFKDKDRPSWEKYVNPLYQALSEEFLPKVKEFIKSRDHWAPHRERTGVTRLSQFKPLPYNDGRGKGKVRSSREGTERKNDDQYVRGNAKKRVRWEDQVNGSLPEPLCSGLEAERLVLIDFSFGQTDKTNRNATHCVMQYQYVLLLKVLLDYSVDYLQGKPAGEFTYGGVDDRFCRNAPYTPDERFLLNDNIKLYLGKYAREIGIGRAKHGSSEYPFLVRLLGESNLSEIGTGRLHYPVQGHNGLRTTLEEFKYVGCQVHGVMKAVGLINQNMFHDNTRDNKILLSLFNSITYSIGNLIESTFRRSIESGGLHRIDFYNVSRLSNSKYVLGIMDREKELHYKILVDRVKQINYRYEVFNCLILKKYLSGEKDSILKYVHYRDLILKQFPKVQDSFKFEWDDSSKVPDLVQFMNYMEEGGKLREFVSVRLDVKGFWRIRPETDGLSFTAGFQGIRYRLDELRRKYKAINSKFLECRKDPRNRWCKRVENNDGILFEEFEELRSIARRDLLDLDHYQGLIENIGISTEDPMEINALKRYEMMAVRFKEDVDTLSYYEHQMVPDGTDL